MDELWGAKLRIQLKSNWIFFEFWLYIYMEKEWVNKVAHEQS